ncbi:hypothetical protein N7G274_006871 [Stereocaulon virgatum]|uniref:Efficient mitochondria targeting-associated protein 19 n=1 Tax=Stereocaulon virgatum TaxID=373712 RepID=A0ABR4A5U0_9LECA
MPSPTWLAWQRKLDMVYLTFFLIHIPIMLTIALYPLSPPRLIPTLLTDIRTWYIATYNDRFFTDPPRWFTLFTVLEAAYHIPVTMTSIGPLWSGKASPTLHLNLLLFALQTALTTMVCIFEYQGWSSETSQLNGLYYPYLFFAVFMCVDMYERVRGRLEDAAKVEEEGRKGI